MAETRTDDELFALLRGGDEWSYGYDAYGSGRVRFTLRACADGAFDERRVDQDLDGSSLETRRKVGEEDMRRHFAASRVG